MTCAKCGHVEANAYAIGRHWKTAHPAEYKKKQHAKKAKRATGAADPELEESAVDPEFQLLSDVLYQFSESVSAGVTPAACERVLDYLRDRFVGSAVTLPAHAHGNGERRVGIS